MDMERITLVILIVIGVYVFWRDRQLKQHTKRIEHHLPMALGRTWSATEILTDPKTTLENLHGRYVVIYHPRFGLQFDRMVKALNFMAFYDWYVRDSFVIKNNITQQWMMYCVLEYRAPARKRDRRDQDG